MNRFESIHQKMNRLFSLSRKNRDLNRLIINDSLNRDVSTSASGRSSRGVSGRGDVAHPQRGGRGGRKAHAHFRRDVRRQSREDRQPEIMPVRYIIRSIRFALF